MTSDSSVVETGPCPKSTCGSSDAYTTYDDGHSYCFSCESYFHASGATREAAGGVSGLLSVAHGDITARRLNEKTCRKWGYGTATYRGAAVQVATYCDDRGNPVAQKIRTRDKHFSIIGNAKEMGLYGKWLWRNSGRKVAVVEGEIDALTLSQLQGLKYPVVSVPNGAQSAPKAVMADLEWLQGFDEVVFMFDNDDPGRQAAERCAALLAPGKAKIAVLPADIKDANQGLVEGRGDEVVAAFWDAKVFRPDGIVGVAEAEARLKATAGMTPIGECRLLQGLQDMTRGFFRGHVWMLCSGSGMGKTELARELEADLLQQDLIVGHIGLEETVDRSLAGVVGTILSERVYLEEDPTAHPRWREVCDWLAPRLYLYDHFGSTEGDALLAKMRFMRVALGCDVIVLDHLSIVVSDLSSDEDERRTIDRLMTKIKSFAIETGALVLCVSHLKRPKGTPHEEGGRTSLGQLRGSASIGQLSNIAIGIERDQQCPKNANISTIRVLKNRHTGATGVAGYLSFDHDSGRMTECQEPEDESRADFRRPDSVVTEF